MCLFGGRDPIQPQRTPFRLTQESGMESAGEECGHALVVNIPDAVPAKIRC